MGHKRETVSRNIRDKIRFSLSINCSSDKVQSQTRLLLPINRRRVAAAYKRLRNRKALEFSYSHTNTPIQWTWRSITTNALTLLILKVNLFIQKCIITATTQPYTFALCECYMQMQSFTAVADDSITRKRRNAYLCGGSDTYYIYIRNERYNFPFLWPKQVCTLFECY